MEQLRRCAVMAFFGLLALGLPIGVFASAFLEERTRDRVGTLIAVAAFATVSSMLGAGAASRICSATVEAPKFGGLDLTWRGATAGLITSFVVALLPRLLRFDGGIYIWPLVIGAPAGFLFVVGFHLLFNRR